MITNKQKIRDNRQSEASPKLRSKKIKRKGKDFKKFVNMRKNKKIMWKNI